jgi:hypothetical protein
MPDYLHDTSSPSFLVELIGMPEAFALRRLELGQQFLDRITALYGSEPAAGAALHAYVDSGDLEPGELPWNVAHDQVVAAMGLPPGAHFRCSIDGLRG